jgi:hypothetical protein
LFLEQLGRPEKCFAKPRGLAIGGFPSNAVLGFTPETDSTSGPDHQAGALSWNFSCDAMEGKLCYGRTHTIRDSAQRRRNHGRLVPRVSNFRETDYKVFERYEKYGLERLTDRASAPNQLPEQVEAAIVAARNPTAARHAKPSAHP